MLYKIIFNGIDGCMFCLTNVWSNERIKACIHRVLLAENFETRYSLWLFSHNNKTICVPEELVDEEHPLHYKPLNLRDYAQEQKRLIAYQKELSQSLLWCLNSVQKDASSVVISM